MRFPWDFFTLYLSLPQRWQPRTCSPSIRRRRTPSANLLSLLVLSSSRFVPWASDLLCSIYFLLSFSCTGFTQQLVFFLHVWQCEATTVTTLIRFDFELAFLQFCRNSTVIPWQPLLVCFSVNIPFLTATQKDGFVLIASFVHLSYFLSLLITCLLSDWCKLAVIALMIACSW